MLAGSEHNITPKKPPRRKKNTNAAKQNEVKPPAPKRKVNWSVSTIEEHVTCEEVVVKVNIYVLDI